MRLDGSVPLDLFIRHLQSLAAPATLHQSRPTRRRGTDLFAPRYPQAQERTTSEADEEMRVVRAIADALRAEVGGVRHADKLVARAANSAPRTAKGWLAEESAPQAAKLIRLMAEFDTVFDAVLELAGRKRPSELSASQRAAVAQALRIIEGQS